MGGGVIHVTGVGGDLGGGEIGLGEGERRGGGALMRGN